MLLYNIEKATEEFKEKLESGYYKTRKEEAHEIAKLFEPNEDYSISKEERDIQAIHDFVNSPFFQEILKKS